MGRGQAPAAPIAMTPLQKEILQDIERQHKTSQQIAKRIKILLMANQGQSNSHIKRELDISLNTVKSWRKRWEAAYDDLVSYESYLENQEGSLSDLGKRLISILKDLPRPGAPKTITLAQEKQIIALACESPADYQIEMTDWTLAMLAKVAIAKGIVATISSRQVGRILKKKPSSTS
ncbi:MAG: helix-turn-helix domain-containing protein [Bacteroidota bacterium]